VKIPHIKVFNKARQDEAKRNLGIAKERVQGFYADAEKLAACVLPREDAVEALVAIMGGKAGEPEEAQGRTIQRMLELYDGAGRGATLVTAKETAWGLLNAVTEFYDHEYGRSPESRLQNAWLGLGDIKKREAYSHLLELAVLGANN